MYTKAGRWGLVAVGLFLAAGCARKLTFERWNTLTSMSSRAEVQEVLGDPDQYRQADHWKYHDPDRQISVNLEFVGQDRITYSRWSDPDHGMHEFGKAEIEDSDVVKREISRTDIDH